MRYTYMYNNFVNTYGEIEAKHNNNILAHKRISVGAKSLREMRARGDLLRGMRGGGAIGRCPNDCVVPAPVGWEPTSPEDVPA